MKSDAELMAILETTRADLAECGDDETRSALEAYACAIERKLAQREDDGRE